MEIIKDKNRLFKLFEELNSGGLERYDDEDQALVLKLESNGGPREDEILYLKFLYVEYFHLPLGLDIPSIDSYGIDEIRLISEEEAREVMPLCSCETLNYRRDSYRCYRLYANHLSSPFYIYCLNVEGWIELS